VHCAAATPKAANSRPEDILRNFEICSMAIGYFDIFDTPVLYYRF